MPNAHLMTTISLWLIIIVCFLSALLVALGKGVCIRSDLGNACEGSAEFSIGTWGKSSSLAGQTFVFAACILLGVEVLGLVALKRAVCFVRHAKTITIIYVANLLLCIVLFGTELYYATTWTTDVFQFPAYNESWLGAAILFSFAIIFHILLLCITWLGNTSTPEEIRGLLRD